MSTSAFLTGSHPSSTYNTFFLSDLKNGYTYNIAIQAKSEQYYEGNFVYGDPYAAQFDTTVKAKVMVGEACNISSECSDSAAVCLFDTCTCDESNYDSNGFEKGGTCNPITDLQVTDVVFMVQTNKIVVSWRPPVGFDQYIDGYTVKWRPKYGDNIEEESESVDSSSTTLTLERGIDPGRAYNITIISKDELSQHGSVRRTSVTRMQSAKPSLTTGLDMNNSELDPSDGKITIAWFDAPGYVQGYRVQLFDGSTLLSRSHPGSLYNTFFLSDLKPGYTYTIAIEAKSEQYYERIIEYGDAFTAQFNTTVKVPGPPREGSCIRSTETSITLLWLPPSDPNGEVTRYNIHVYRESKLEFTLSTTGNETVHTVDGLFPGNKRSHLSPIDNNFSVTYPL
ncbi:fibronectin-like [Mercenaria mercenaria]|uniref:fibronectin-like n=1 Tax=Mercenaria mercenaria TaxID=6596 RepID=UPI00234F564B|nr:fibronectin-like [Mercenaria mercenaria]